MTFKKKLIKDITTKINTWNPKAVSKSQKFEYIDIAAVSRELKEITTSLSLETSEAPSRARQIIKERDVLVSTVRPNLNAVARVTSDFDGATASTGFTVLRPKPNELDPDYLYYWVCSPCFVADMTQQSTGASYPAVSDTIVKNSKIPLPPIAEQKRIAAILDKADAVRRKRREAIRLTEELLRSVFLDMFGDPVTNPKGWDVVNFGDVCINFQNGIGKGKKYYGSGAKVANISDLYEWHKFTPTKYSLLESTPGEIEKYRLSKGDLLFVRSSVKKQGVAYCSFYNSSEVCLFSSFMIRARLDREVADPEFVSLMFRTTSMRERLIAASNTSTITNISQPALSGVSIIVPPLSEQKKLERAVKAIERMTNKFTQNQKESEDLFNSLLQRAFTGNL